MSLLYHDGSYPNNLLVIQMPEKELSEKKRAHMAFKKMKVGLPVTVDERTLVKQYYPFMRG